MNRMPDAYKPMWSLNHAISLMGWDLRLICLGKAQKKRSGRFSTSHATLDLLLNKDFVGLVESAKKLVSPGDLEKGIIRVLNREITKQEQFTQRVD